MEHKLERLTGSVIGFGKFADINKVFTARNNQDAVFQIYSSKSGDRHFWDRRRLIYRDQVMDVKDEGGGMNRFALSFDGQKLARVTKRDSRRDEYFVILINGVAVYETRITNMWHIFWLSNEELVWTGYVDNGPRTYVNGQDVTGKLDYQPFSDYFGNQHLGTVVRNLETGEEYAVDVNGSTVGKRALEKVESFGHKPEGEWRAYWYGQLGRRRPELGKWPKYSCLDGGYTLTYNGVTGPFFREVFLDRELAFTEDLSSVGYICRNTSLLNRALSGACFGAQFCLDEVSSFMKHYFGIFGREVTRPVDWFSLQLLLHLPGTDIHQPCVNDKPWSKSYRRAEEPTFVSGSRLAVIAWPNGSNCCVSVDCDDGPLFDHVRNLKYDKSSRELSYIGIRGDEAFRGSVKV